MNFIRMRQRDDVTSEKTAPKIMDQSIRAEFMIALAPYVFAEGKLTELTQSNRTKSILFKTEIDDDQILKAAKKFS